MEFLTGILISKNNKYSHIYIYIYISKQTNNIPNRIKQYNANTKLHLENKSTYINYLCYMHIKNYLTYLETRSKRPINVKLEITKDC